MSTRKQQEAFLIASKALKAFGIILNKPNDPDRMNIDAAIQRFEFAFELFWKLLKRVLESKGVLVAYPRDVLEEAYAGGLIDEESLWLEMLKDRNLTPHTYNEKLADEVFQHLEKYHEMMQATLKKLEHENKKT